MKCPKCQKNLELVQTRAGDFYSHSYTLAYILSNKLVCDYSQPAKMAEDSNTSAINTRLISY